MLYYSEKSNKFYKTEKELHEAEKDYDKEQAEKEKKIAAKKERAKEIENAYVHAQEVRKSAAEMIQNADKEYYDLRNQFIKDYGSFHMSYSNDKVKVEDIWAELADMLSKFPF